MHFVLLERLRTPENNGALAEQVDLVTSVKRKNVVIGSSFLKLFLNETLLFCNILESIETSFFSVSIHDDIKYGTCSWVELYSSSVQPH